MKLKAHVTPRSGVSALRATAEGKPDRLAVDAVLEGVLG
jgi:hypothetical protein